MKNRVEGICRNPYMMGIVIAGIQTYRQKAFTRTKPRGGGTSSSSGLMISLMGTSAHGCTYFVSPARIVAPIATISTVAYAPASRMRPPPKVCQPPVDCSISPIKARWTGLIIPMSRPRDVAATRGLLVTPVHTRVAGDCFLPRPMSRVFSSTSSPE